MKTSASKSSPWLRGAALLAGLAALEAAILRLVGPVPDQVQAVSRLGDPAVQPVSGLLDLLAVVTELVAAYLAIVVSLRLLTWLPGAVGRLASGGLRLLTLPAVRRMLDGLVGGALLAQVALSPASVHAAGTGSSRFAPRPVATATAAWLVPRPPATSATRGAPAASPSSPDGVAPASTVPGPPWIPWATWPGGAARLGPTVTGGPAASTTVAPPTVIPPRFTPGVPVPHPAVGAPGPRGGQAAAGTAQGGASTPAGAAANAHRDGRQYGHYTIRPGDTLWGIAAAQLPADSRSVARVSRYWRQIYAANRTAIGNDPDLIRPGTRLTIPSFQAVPSGHP